MGEEEEEEDGFLMPLMKLFPPQVGGGLMAAPQTAHYWHCSFFHPFEPALRQKSLYLPPKSPIYPPDLQLYPLKPPFYPSNPFSAP